jgi:hypothetical protein
MDNLLIHSWVIALLGVVLGMIIMYTILGGE